jgi:predicted transcriptional regulator of viral defense system
MNRLAAMQVLKQQAGLGRFVFLKTDLAKLFPDERSKALSEALARLVKAGLLVHAAHGVYLNPMFRGDVLEHISRAMRRGKYNYISLESILSEYGLISQIPTDHLTLMTTGKGGVYKTPYGVIEFTHTKRSIADILNSTMKDKNRPLRIASKETAIRDLKRVGRNTHLLIEEAL